jgi:hypothetical protein
MDTTVDEDNEGMTDDGRQLTVLGNKIFNPLLELDEEEQAELEELPELTDEKLYQLTEVNSVTLSDEDFRVTEANLSYTKALHFLKQAVESDAASLAAKVASTFRRSRVLRAKRPGH